jgi:signal transduction histidine kinase
MVDLLLNTPLDDQQLEYTNIIKRSSDSLLSLINDILDFSKMEAGKLQLDYSVFDIHGAIEDVIELMGESANAKNLDLIYTSDIKDVEYFKGDSGRLKQILINLVCNAIKFTEKGEIIIRSKIDSLGENSATLLFEVVDTGIGISEELRSKLFQPFIQLESKTSRKYQGTGLGLVRNNISSYATDIAKLFSSVHM